MHDVLRQRLMRQIEALPEAQLYQALDYVEFLASKYARGAVRAPTGWQRFGERLEDKMRGQGLAFGAIRGTLGAIGTADRVFSGIAEAGRSLLREVEDGVRGVAGSGDAAAPPQNGTPPAPESRVLGPGDTEPRNP
jgi:hypothetical protein